MHNGTQVLWGWTYVLPLQIYKPTSSRSCSKGPLRLWYILIFSPPKDRPSIISKSCYLIINTAKAPSSTRLPASYKSKGRLQIVVVLAAQAAPHQIIAARAHELRATDNVCAVQCLASRPISSSCSSKDGLHISRSASRQSLLTQPQIENYQRSINNRRSLPNFATCRVARVHALPRDSLIFP
jgi:hypothetical protein